MLKNFRTYHLALQFFKRAQTIPLRGELKDQLERASSSIVLNIAEGAGKFFYPKDQKRFYRIAFASLRESQSILDMTESVDPEIVLLADKLGAHLYKLII